MEHIVQIIKNYKIKEFYCIHVDLEDLKRREENIINRLHSLIFSSFLIKYDAVRRPFCSSLSFHVLDKLFAYITSYTSITKFQELLRELEVPNDKIENIIKDFENKKYSRILLQIDELKRAKQNFKR